LTTIQWPRILSEIGIEIPSISNQPIIAILSGNVRTVVLRVDNERAARIDDAQLNCIKKRCHKDQNAIYNVYL